ncbi:LysE/ArgO family amino acid transporter [Stackebrandtia albiflava]|uniref:LysE/ArgO family amino acid transporter n=1 Tax=Stackebrandtia albiflava TaxID=406432 RepID=UPI0011BFB7C5|nr:LysE/ArgO family amino acid transporter [Stackebrandtia albiflava]
MTDFVIPVLTGLGAGLSLIVAIGAQNAFVLRQGLRTEHVAWVVTVCAVSDAVLIVAGVAGIGVLIQAAPGLLTVTRYAGAAFLLGYAALAARRVWNRQSMTTRAAGDRAGLGAVLATCLALTWLNPHVYLDTVILLGSIANSHPEPDRWLIGAGAVAGSVAWFTALGFGARLLSPLFARPIAWRLLDALIAVVMTVLAVTLLLGT